MLETSTLYLIKPISQESKMKICPSCLENLENCNFYKDSTRKDSMRTYCKNCTKTKFSDSRKKYYLKNKEKFTKKSKEWAEKNRDKSRKYKKKYKDKKIIEIKNLINSYKKECLICKEQDIRCLELHHMNKEDKKFLVSKMKYSITNIPIIIKEINKCVCLCSNCHRKEHFKNRIWPAVYSAILPLGDSLYHNGITLFRRVQPFRD